MGADPVIVRHKDAYYLFMTLADGYWRSTDLIDWTFITPSRWPFGGIVAPAANSDGDRLILWPSMSFTRPGSILVSSAGHGLWNGLTYILFGVGSETGALGITETGTFGPEVGLYAIFLNGAVGALLWWIYRDRFMTDQEPARHFTS